MSFFSEFCTGKRQHGVWKGILYEKNDAEIMHNRFIGREFFL